MFFREIIRMKQLHFILLITLLSGNIKKNTNQYNPKKIFENNKIIKGLIKFASCVQSCYFCDLIANTTYCNKTKCLDNKNSYCYVTKKFIMKKKVKAIIKNFQSIKVGEMNAKTPLLNETDYYYFKGCASAICVTSLFSKSVLNESHKVVSEYCCSRDNCNGDFVNSEFKLPFKSHSPHPRSSFDIFKNILLIGIFYYFIFM